MKSSHKLVAFLLIILLAGTIMLSGCSTLGILTMDPAGIIPSEAAEAATFSAKPTAPAESPLASPSEETAVAAYFPTPIHADVSYSDMKYTHYETASFDKVLDDFTLAVQTGTEPFSSIQAKYEALYAEVTTAATMYSLAEIEFNNNTADENWTDEYDYSYTTYLDIADRACTAVRDALKSGYSADLTAYLGEDATAEFLDYKDMSDHEADLWDRESELTTEYDQAIVQDVSVKVDGREWTYADLNEQSSTLDYDEYYQILYALEKKQNEEVGDIFLELVDIRTEIAQIYGYDNYADYAYEEVFSRDYTTTDAAVFCATVRNTIAPTFFNEIAFSDPMYYEFGQDSNFSTQQLLDILKKYSARISPEVTTVADYLTEYGLYSIGSSDVGADVGYTTTLYSYQEPFLFNRTYGTPIDVSDTVHEFGHFIDGYYNLQNNILSDANSYDISEVHSQGLESLFDAYYGEIFSSEEVLPARVQHLTNLLSSVISGCIEDEFQQAVYTNPDMTLDEINKTYHDIYQSYGYQYNEDIGVDYEWININHTFTSPMYYISYATSALTALDIWADAQVSQDDAIDKYLNFMSYGAYDYGYIELLNKCGFGNFTQDGYVEEVTKPVISTLETLCKEYGTDFGDFGDFGDGLLAS